MSRFNVALNRFKKRLIENAGTAVEIVRESQTIFKVAAVPASSKIDYLTDKGIRTTTIVYDFVVPVDLGWEPKRGDRILWNGASYIVRPVGAEWFRYDDAERVFLRVHTQLENTEQP